MAQVEGSGTANATPNANCLSSLKPVASKRRGVPASPTGQTAFAWRNRFGVRSVKLFVCVR